MKQAITFALKCTVIGCVAILAACGRYSKPLPPQEFAPAAVKKLEITGQIEGIKLAWLSPSNDARGKDLKELEGYRVYRRTLTTIADVVRLTGEEQLVTTVPDTHLKEITAMKDELTAQKRSARRVTLPAERYKFDYLDTQVAPSVRYAYRVVPINQEGVEGVFDQVGQVFFLGERSEITLIPVKE